MDQQLKKTFSLIANTIRQLSMEAIQKANSGHPGLPLGCAEIGAYLYGKALSHNPKHSHWLARDRFILSAGHGSMLLYSCLHLAGFNISLDDIKNFRQKDSVAAGHPEYETDGVEATTGPLGQGIGNAVGLALGFKILSQKFNKDSFPIFNNKIYCLVGDGCIMEGASAEASSLAGHWNLDNLIVIYDANKISLDGPLSESCSEDTKQRYKSYGFDVFEVDGHDLEAIDKAISNLKENQNKPAIIIANTTIGKGSPHKEGSHKVHGSPLGQEEVVETKKALQLPDEEFFISQEVKKYFEEKQKEQQKLEDDWNEMLDAYSKKYPELYADFLKMKDKELGKDFEEKIEKIPIETPIAGRVASHSVVNKLVEDLPFIYGGSADLSCSDMTYLDKYPMITKDDFSGRNIKYGVREFAMGTISSGLYLTGMMTPFCGTFLVFSDYMRNPMRIAALSSWHVIYQLTHDSVFLGEDGPTHQPVEQLAALRAIPNLLVIRPASAWEVKMAWIAALKHIGPTAIVLSRQKIEEVEKTHVSFAEGLGRGAYIVKKEKKKCDFTLFATGSELTLAIEVAEELEKEGRDVRIVSFPCFKLFERQEESYKKAILDGDLGIRVSIEAGSSFGWHKYIGREGIAISVDEFGISAPMKEIKKKFGFTKDQIVKKLLKK